MTTFWLSFADVNRPEGTQFKGAAIVEGDDPVDAIQEAWRLGINPGGEVAISEISPDAPIRDRWRKRLLSREDIDALDLELGDSQALE